MLKPEDDPYVGSKHVAYLIQPYTIKDSCARRTSFVPFYRFIRIVSRVRIGTNSDGPRGTTRLPLNGLPLNLIFEEFLKICRETHFH